MSRSDLEVRITHWLDEGPHAAPTDVVEAALAQARREPQARVFALPWARLPRFGDTDFGPLLQAATGLAVATLAVVAVIWAFNYAALPPAASPSPSAPASNSPSPSAAPTASP